MPPVNYGLLYNYYTIIDSRNIANIGWKVPLNSDYATLILNLGDWFLAGGKMKEVGTIHWNDPNTGATNSSKFNAVGSGLRSTNGNFQSLKVYGHLLSIDDIDINTQGMLYLENANQYAQQSGGGLKWTGAAVRLMKLSTSLSDGEIGGYVGNDGRKYPTICVNGQEWLSCNLAETKYRNGDLIPEVTDNTTWTELTTGSVS